MPARAGIPSFDGAVARGTGSVIGAVHVISESTDEGVVERRFDVTTDGENVPGIIWTAARASEPAPVILIGHGATQHKRVANVLSLARRFVSDLGFTAVAIDAPDHGDRVVDVAASDARRAQLARRISAGPSGASVMNMSADDTRRWVENIGRGVRDWRATIDMLETQGLVGEGRFGYWGVSMGTMIGLPLLASEPRVRAAVLGLAGLPPVPGPLELAARNTTAPVLFVFQWDDELVSRDAGLRLFDALGSTDKAMHIHPGGHLGIPIYERLNYVTFFKRHLAA
jgi:dienelactone hydrolase